MELNLMERAPIRSQRHRYGFLSAQVCSFLRLRGYLGVLMRSLNNVIQFSEGKLSILFKICTIRDIVRCEKSPKILFLYLEKYFK